MNAAILDTSVALAWYLPEKWSRRARELRRAALDGELRLLVPGLHFWELGNVLRTYVRRGELDEAVAAEIWSVHQDAPLEPTEPDREAVLGTALEYGATVYDAVFIRLALELELPLLTAERTTTPWVVRLGDRVEIVR